MFNKSLKWLVLMPTLMPAAIVISCNNNSTISYDVEFSNNDQIRATFYQNVKPNDLTADQFKAEVLAHQNDLFKIHTTLAKDFFEKNLQVEIVEKNNQQKLVKANVKLNNATSDHKAISKVITLTNLDYQPTELEKLTYKIEFKENDSNSQTINLNNQANQSVETVTSEQLIDLVLLKENQDQILKISGTDATKITQEILANQILTIDQTKIQKDQQAGTIEFELKVNKAENGAGNPLTKTIIFSGFKTENQEPVENKFKIKFKDGDEFNLDGVSDQLASSFYDGNLIKPIIIKNKEKLFEAQIGQLPEDQTWWDDNLVVTKPAHDDSQGIITANIILDNSDQTISPGAEAVTIQKQNVKLKGFKTKS